MPYHAGLKRMLVLDIVYELSYCATISATLTRLLWARKNFLFIEISQIVRGKNAMTHSRWPMNIFLPVRFFFGIFVLFERVSKRSLYKLQVMKYRIIQSQYFCSCPTFWSCRILVDFIYSNFGRKSFNSKQICLSSQKMRQLRGQNRHNTRKEKANFTIVLEIPAKRNVEKSSRTKFFSVSGAIAHFVYAESHYWCWECFDFSLLSGKSICV